MGWLKTYTMQIQMHIKIIFLAALQSNPRIFSYGGVYIEDYREYRFYLGWGHSEAVFTLADIAIILLPVPIYSIHVEPWRRQKYRRAGCHWPLGTAG